MSRATRSACRPDGRTGRRAPPRTSPARRRPLGLRGELGVLVDVAERQVSEHEAEVALEGLKEPSNGGLRPSTVRAFEVAILDQGHRRAGRPANVVDVGVDGCGEVLERSGDAIFPSAEYPP